MVYLILILMLILMSFRMMLVSSFESAPPPEGSDAHSANTTQTRLKHDAKKGLENVGRGAQP